MENIDEWHARAYALLPWHEAFELLSLDCWLPFWSDMGLCLPRENQMFVRNAARASYQVLHGTDCTCYDGNYDPDVTAETRDRFLMSLAAQCEPDFADRMRLWVHRNCDSQSLGARLDFMWFGTLCDVYHSERKPFEIIDSKLCKLKDLIRNDLIAPFQQTGKQTSRVQTISDWDRNLRKAQFDPKYPDRDEIPYQPQVCLVVLSQRLKRLWHHILELCDDTEIAALHARYRRREHTTLKRWPELDRLPMLD
jgi:hypothetical protein